MNATLHRLLFSSLLAICLIGLWGCASVSPKMTYSSSEAVAKIPVDVVLEVDLHVNAQRALEAQGVSAGRSQAAVTSFKNALETDLEANGPFRINVASPQATLRVEITDIHVVPPDGAGHWAWAVPAFPVVFGVPYERTDIDMIATATLTDMQGRVLTSVGAEVSDSTYTGVYYNHTVTLEDAAEELTEVLRARLAERNDRVLAALGDAPRRLASTTTTDSTQTPGASAADDLRFVPAAPQPTAYALIIGVERYRDVPVAEGAARDTALVERLMRETFHVPENNIRVALNDRATKGDIEKHLQWLADSAPAGSRIYFYFSGHGAPDAESQSAFILPYDADPQRINSSGLAMAHVMGRLNDTEAKEVYAFVDSCFSGSGGRSVLPKGIRPLVPTIEHPTSSKVTLFSSSSGSQVSGAVPDGEGGLFTAYLTEGLATGGADINGDGQISLQELGEWVTPRVERRAREADRSQTPALKNATSLGATEHQIIVWGLPRD